MGAANNPYDIEAVARVKSPLHRLAIDKYINGDSLSISIVDIGCNPSLHRVPLLNGRNLAEDTLKLKPEVYFFQQHRQPNTHDHCPYD